MRKICWIWSMCFCICSLALSQEKYIQIVHTNDTHSQIDHLWNKHQEAYCGEAARRIHLIRTEKAKDPEHTIVLDAGDFCQGSPFFTFYKGRIEVELMNRAGYDVVTLGNHEFDNGVDSLAMILQKAKFDIVCANMDFSQSALKGMIKPYVVMEKDGVKVGIFGLIVELKGLVSDDKTAGVVWKDPIEIAKTMVKTLKEEHECDIIVALSHLGNSKGMEIPDSKLAAQVPGIDVIIGGHSHQFIYPPEEVKHEDSTTTYISQMASKGSYVGKMRINCTKR